MMHEQEKSHSISLPSKAERIIIMALFEKSLNAIKTLDSTIRTANETFKAEQKRLLDTYKDPSKEIGEVRAATDNTIMQAKAAFHEVITADYNAVRGKVHTVVTAAPPADFMATLEAIKANGRNISDYEAAAFVEKYKGNYFASRTLDEVLTAAGKKLGSYVKKPDHIADEIDKSETMLHNWGRRYTGSSYMTALLLNHTNPVTMLADMVQQFLDGKYTTEEE